MRASAVALLLVGPVACAGIIASSAGGHAAADRPGQHGVIAHIACTSDSPPGCKESGTETLPGDTYGSQQTDIVPADTQSATIKVEPPENNDVGFGSLWSTVVQGYPKLANVKSAFVQQVIVCHLFAQGIALRPQAVKVTEADEFGAYYFLFMQACLAYVVQAQQQAGATNGAVRAGASSPCNGFAVAVPVQIARSGNRYRMRIHATTRPAGNAGTLRITCSPAGRGMVIGIRPKQRHARLGPLVGGHVQVGFWNPTKHPVAARNTYTFQ